MVVTIDAAGLVAALRLGDSAEELAEVTRILAYATEAAVNHAPDAPDVAHNEAGRRLAGYLFDQPEAGRSDAYANALRNSGAARMYHPGADSAQERRLGRPSCKPRNPSRRRLAPRGRSSPPGWWRFCCSFGAVERPSKHSGGAMSVLSADYAGSR